MPSLCGCGLAFVPKNDRQVYCGARCARRARKVRADARYAAQRVDAGPTDLTVRCGACGRLDVIPSAERTLGCRHCGATRDRTWRAA